MLFCFLEENYHNASQLDTYNENDIQLFFILYIKSY